MRLGLALKGGGIRGIISMTLLKAIEDASGRQAAEAFHLLAGTSTGGIAALALAVPGEDGRPLHTADDVRDLYLKRGPEIFDASALRTLASGGGLFEEQYSSDGLLAVLNEYFGDLTLGDALVPVIVTAYDIEARKPVYLNSRDHPEVLMIDAALATSAAPTYFEPALIKVNGELHSFIDGGVFENNPADTVADILGDLCAVVAIGTGYIEQPINPDAARDWGALRWMRPVLDIFMDGQDKAASARLRDRLKGRYIELDGSLSGASEAMDDVSEENLEELVRDGEDLVARHDAHIEVIVERFIGRTAAIPA